MIKIYCAAKHGTSGILCDDCSELDIYARTRLERCRYGDNKPTCRKCPVHCYNPEMKTRIQEVMRFSGPRMLFRSPLLAIIHLMKGFK